MTIQEIKNTSEIVDFMLDKSVITESKIKLYKRLEEICELAIKALEQQSCEDCISRQAVIEWLKDKDIIKTKNQEENARRELAELPSVEPERKTGKQPESGRLIKYSVHGHDACKCSRCNTDLGYPYEGKFCKWCGAKMEVN